ncbi:hypothetical protein AAG570_012465 [Ranatra chinensis]|uniref:Uncharacterized protein n=1 Tax=Ranatra chinensis TaxID=642074 RepID=A0ABD0YE05_9HEMI
METLEDVAVAPTSSVGHTVATFHSIKTEITMLMEIINGIKEFDGHSIDLQEFTILLLAMHAQLAAESNVLDEVRVRNLYNMLVRRVSAGVRAEVGITFLTSANDMLTRKWRGRLSWRRASRWSLEAALVLVDDDEDEVRAAVEIKRPSRNRRNNRRHDNERQRTRGARTRPRATSGSYRRNRCDLGCNGKPMEVNAMTATRRGMRRSMIRRESDSSDSDRSSGSFSSGIEGSAARRRTYAVVTAQRKTSSVAKASASA